MSDLASKSVVVRGRTVAHDDVLRAVDLCDEMGEAAFLTAFGYGRAVRWHLRVNGKSYPSKAILGVAAGLKHTEHFGGAAHTVNALAQLGFHVRNSATGAFVEPQGLEAHRAEAERFYRAACAEKGTKVPFPVWPANLPVLPTHYFASGSNTPAHIHGLADSGWDVGVEFSRVTRPSERALASLAGSEVDVFVDSGAFREVDFGPNGPEVTHPISEADWAKILGLYGRLADALGSQVFVVAPDRVGDQDVTLARLERWAPQLKALHEAGARVLVPMQKGAVTQAEFAQLVETVLGTGWWIPALPCNKSATSAEEVAAFLAAYKPSHVHLLGIGVWSKGAARYLAPFASTSTTVSMDSAWVPAKTGKGSSRIYTISKAASKRALEAAGWVGKKLVNAYNVLGLMVCCGHPTPTRTESEVKAEEPGLPWPGAAEVA